MWKADQWKDYEVLDTSDGEKLERWGSFYLVRPDPQVIWSTPRQDPRWKRFDARYARSSTGGGHWSAHHLPEHWCIRYRELTFQVKPMNFKHTGVFPEQAANWDFINDQIRRAGRPVSVLNLFAYTGGATISAAKAGASVTHVDASKGMVAWAKENAGIAVVPASPGEIFDNDLICKIIRDDRLFLNKTLSIVKGRPLSNVAQLFLNYFSQHS